MSPNFVITTTFPQPSLDAGVLIDGAFPGEPARHLAKGIVTRLLTDGEKVRYADGRIGLYLATEHRPAVQALLDGMPAEDRQRLLELLTNTVASPALEGLIQGRWPTRGFLLEARAAFRTPELREHLPAVPGQALLEKFGAAKRVIQDHSPQSPGRALLDLLARFERDALRTASGDPVSRAEFAVRCRSDPQTLALARQLTNQLQDTSIAFFQALRGPPTFYLPRTPGGTGGEGETLNVIDRADIADHCSFLCYVAYDLLAQSWAPEAPGKGHEMTGPAVTWVARSVLEALLLTFFQRRFPGMAVPADAEVEGPRPQSAEERERARRQLDRKVPLLLQSLALFASFREAAQSLPEVFWQGKAQGTPALVGNVLDALEKSVRGWANLRVLADTVEIPWRVDPPATPSSVFLHPLPDLSLLRCLEEPGGPEGPPVESLRIVATYCRHDPGAPLVHSSGRKYPGKGGVGADISVHAPGQGACLSADTYVPVSQFLHPEDPASIVADFLARQAGRAVGEILEMLQICELERQAREAAADVPRLDFLHIKRAVRGGVFFQQEPVEHCVYLVMRHQDAVRLGILERVRPLPPSEQALLREHFRFCPENPVALRLECKDDGDDGGGEGPPPPPSPAPERREDKEDAPTSDKVGVG
jgi:hypothetical protein